MSTYAGINPDTGEEISWEQSSRDGTHRLVEAKRRNAELEREITGLRNSYWAERKAVLKAREALAILRDEMKAARHDISVDDWIAIADEALSQASGEAA